MILKENYEKKKAILGTYNLNNYSIVRFNDLLENYELVDIDVPEKKYMEGKDWSYLYMGEKTGKIFREECSEDYEAVILGDGTKEYDFESLKKTIEKFAQRGKDICVLYDLNNEQQDTLMKKFSEYSVKIDIYNGMQVNISDIEIDDKRIYEVEVPVVLVTSITERAHKIDSVLSIKKNLEKLGYRVSAIGSKNFSKLFGIHSFPQFMYENIKENEKILYFNAICKYIECNEKPDIFIISAPGALEVYNNLFTNYFGILPYEISKAVEPDYVLVSIPYGEYDEQILEEIANRVRYKLGCQHISYGMTNCFIDINSSKEEGKVQYCNSNYEEIENKVKIVTSVDMYNLLSNIQFEKIVDEIVNTLTYN